jgi:hypothetical protein
MSGLLHLASEQMRGEICEADALPAERSDGRLHEARPRAEAVQGERSEARPSRAAKRRGRW